ncbi:unnamed protein product, partial [Cladocopium goreaui]
MSCRELFVQTLCHGLFWLGFCHCIHDGMLPFCETLLYASLSYMLCTVWPTLVDAAVSRIARVLTKRARGSKPCRRIKGRRYKPCRGRRRQRRRKKAWTRLWHWSRKLRNRLAHALHGNGPGPTDASSNSGTASGGNTATEQPGASYTVEARAQRLRRVPVDIPGDGWCLLHAVSWYLERHESHEPEWSVRKAADTYVQALEFLVQQFDGPSAADINIACMPDQPAELELHRRFLERRGILLPDELPQGLLVLWSKLTAVLEMPNMLDSIHHGTSVEVWALTKAFDFEVLVWSTDVDANYWIATMERVTDAKALRLAELHPHALHLVHQPMGHTGHYSLLWEDRPPVSVWQPTPWLQIWHREGAQALQQHLGMIRVQPSRGEPAEQPNQPKASPATAEAAAEPSNPTASDQDPWPAPATPPCSSGSEVGFADTESIVSWNSHQSSEGSSAAPSLALEPERAWCTLEDQYLEQIQTISRQFRTKPLLPPSVPHVPVELADSMSGVPYPACHCAFAGCTWCSDAQPCVDALLLKDRWIVQGVTWHCSSGTCCNDTAACLWAHLHSQHALAFQHCPGDLVSSYIAALKCVEEQSVPAVGWSVDRRTLRRLHAERQEEQAVALICACCAAVLPSGPRSDIGYLSVQNIFEALTPESFQQNWDLMQYRTSYGSHAAVQRQLHGAEWQRTLPQTLFQGQSILCCPEDLRCSACPAAGMQLCRQCELPLCRACWKRMRQGAFSGIPAALCNDNFYGYPAELLYQHRVRWIETAAASPLWTSMVSFYLEADRGHVLEEPVHRAEHRLAIRGNISAVSLPWEEIYGHFAQKTPHDRIATLPHALPALRAMVKVTVKGMRHAELVEWVAGAHLRPHVVVALLEHLVDIRHPMLAAYDGTPAELKQLFRSKVQREYGTEEICPVTVEEQADLAGAAPTPPQTKNATPEPANLPQFGGEAFLGNSRPQVLSPDYTSSQAGDTTTQEVTRLAQVTPKVTIQTGTEFWDQWQTDYLAWAFPFSIPSPVGGPDFPNKDRPRRKADAAVLGPVPHLRSLARRVESSLRNSWDLISGLRRLTFKWHSVCQAPLYRAWRSKTNALQATPAHEWVEAAKALYHKLQKGKYLTPGKTLKPINYDARKLWFAEEPIFMTLSPTTRHNALCLRLSRYRQHDPGAGPLSGKHVPRVWEKAEVIVPVPEYETRRQTTVRDPWAVDTAFQCMVRFVFAELLGIRMCFRCPNCSCRDALGQSTHPMGGILGLVLGFCGAIEYQKNSNPHFHANVYVATVWQQPLKKLAQKIQATAITLEELFRYQAWLHNESHFNLEQHEALFPALEKKWMQNFPGTEHDRLCLWPAFVAADTTPSPWLPQVADGGPLRVGRCSSPAHAAESQNSAAPTAAANPKDLQTDAIRYRQLYQTAVQVKLSHQQHHMHTWDAKHQCHVPLPACQKKDAPNKCKHGFPKTICDVARVVCRGNARKFRQSTAGRRNALGCVLNPRDNQWLSGTMHAFTLMFMGNSHTGINFRIPLLPETHELQQAAKHLSYLDITPEKGAEAKHYRKVLHRVCGDLEFRCSVRPLTEEVMLAGFWDGDEPTSAECIRSFAVIPFVGCEWIAQYDKAKEVRHRVKPTHHRQAHLKSSDLYGWRGQDPRLRYLSPWEFTALWEVQRLQPPSDLSEWCPGCGAGPEPADGWQFGRDYRWKQHILADNSKHIVPLPSRASTAAGADYYFVRRPVPLIPYPTSCPLPKADMSKDEQARLLNIYLRPWTLAGDDATLHVPHIQALDIPITDRQKKPSHRCVGKTSVGCRSHHTAWKDYIRHHIVSANAARTISNFLAAAECSPDDVEEATVDEARKPDREVDTSWVDMTTVQRLTAGERFQYSKRSAQTVQSLVHDWTTPQTSTSNQGPRQFSTGLPDPGPAPATGAAGTDPFAQQTQPPRPVATNYGTFRLDAARTWLQALNRPGMTPAPNPQQKQVLTAVVERCHAEAVEERADKQNRSEPFRAILHGVPGAGKSQTLHWLRTFFETVCDWQHLHEFAFVAPQNTQAALIDGITIRSFADIRVQGKKHKKETAFGPDHFVKYQHLRWLIIDECSTSALEVLA